MIYKQTTQVPNALFDLHLPNLTEAELKILLIIIRQTSGWACKLTGRRKTRDRITHNQFIKKTGLSRRVISKALNTLSQKRLINVYDYSGSILHSNAQRKGKSFLLYSASFQQPYTKPQKSSGLKSIGDILTTNYSIHFRSQP